ncbi:MAG: hypothetical protein PHU70_09725, partial [Dehalococcoidia bacterium]|nr:hypothetical protein [Dehalococcoidia bacterium]
MLKKVKPQAKQKEQPKIKEQTGKFLAKVPEGSIFWCHDGCTFVDMKELAKGLVAISDDTFSYHVNTDRNDF